MLWVLTFNKNVRLRKYFFLKNISPNNMIRVKLLFTFFKMSFYMTQPDVFSLSDKLSIQNKHIGLLLCIEYKSQ